MSFQCYIISSHYTNKMHSAAALQCSDDLVTYDELLSAQATLQSYVDVLRTPMLRRWPIGDSLISLKLESLQTTGSFKIRGMRYKMHKCDVDQLRENGIVTLSAGNAGKAVSYLAKAMNVNAKVFMPLTAPDDRKIMMESMGATVVKVARAAAVTSRAALRFTAGPWCRLALGGRRVH